MRNGWVLVVGCLVACGESSAPPVDSGTVDAPMAVDAPGVDAPGVDAPGVDTGPRPDAGRRSCGGIVGAACEDDEFCDYSFDDSCGADDGGGFCEPRPMGCPDIADPTCACDGMVYGNACEANAAGFDVNALRGGCTPPEGTFGCGARFCDMTSYCLVIVDDTGLPPAYECRTLPGACGAEPTCACVAEEPCGDICEERSDHLEVVCPGG